MFFLKLLGLGFLGGIISSLPLIGFIVGEKLAEKKTAKKYPQ